MTVDCGCSFFDTALIAKVFPCGLTIVLPIMTGWSFTVIVTEVLESIQSIK